MKYLDEGFYYQVYDIGNGKVLKKFQPYWFSFRKIFAYYRQHGKTLTASIIGAHRSRMRGVVALLMMKEKLKTVPPNFFADPNFSNFLNYYQDKVTIVGVLQGQYSFDQGKNIIDQYIQLQKILWSYGLHDKTYKLQTNYGIDRDGNVVCLDFGEFAFTQKEALRSIANRKWLARGSYQKWVNGPLKAYYTNAMNGLMTERILRDYWDVVKTEK